MHRLVLDTPETYLALRELIDHNQFLLPARRLFHSVFQDLSCVSFIAAAALIFHFDFVHFY